MNLKAHLEKLETTLCQLEFWRLGRSEERCWTELYWLSMRNSVLDQRVPELQNRVRTLWINTRTCTKQTRVFRVGEQNVLQSLFHSWRPTGFTFLSSPSLPGPEPSEPPAAEPAWPQEEEELLLHHHHHPRHHHHLPRLVPVRLQLVLVVINQNNKKQ